jgi:endonuclease/exonuclease/phosphatase (EEP) superfamily protein YafD
MELDFILYSRGIEIDRFSVPNVTFSDHRPLLCDFRVTGERRAAA